jgi:CDP-diacylglycerol--glycerol-3-phosphate 3-phosphatidyltransferase/cardiolipin synthase
MKSAIPSAVSVLRLAAVPPLAAGTALGRPSWAIAALGYACVTDLVDGYLARRLGAVSSLGAYVDVTADFLVVLAGFAGFAWRGVYPWWMPFIIVLMFAQFIVTSQIGRPVYDPVGKYYGALLFVGIGVTLLLPDLAVHELVLAIVVGCTLVSLITRVRYLTASPRAARTT